MRKTDFKFYSMQLSVAKLLLLLVLSEQDVLSSFLQILVYMKILLQSIEIMLEVFNVTGINIESQIIRLRDKCETKLLRCDLLFWHELPEI